MSQLEKEKPLGLSELEIVQNEESLKENLKLIMNLMVDDVWKNFDNYAL